LMPFEIQTPNRPRDGVNFRLWHTYTLTASAAAGTQVYVDGTLGGTLSTTGGGPINPTGNAYLGARSDLSATRYLNAGGAMDSVALYDHALSAAEVAGLAATPQQATATITVNPVNDAPTATITPLTYAATEQTSLTLHGTGLSIADVDASGATVQATLSVVSGALNVAAGTTGVTVGNSGTATVSLSGTVAQINNLLAGSLSGTVTYVINSDTPPATDTLTLTASDLGNAGTGGTLTANDTATINITAVNDAPAVTDRALSLDGTDIVVVPPQASLVMGATVTIEAMVQRTGALGGTQIIVNKEGEYEIGISATGKLQWAFANTTPGWAWVETAFTIPADTWVHVAVTYNSGVVKVYANGSLVDTYNGSGNIGDAYPAMNDLTIGGRQNASTQRFVGLIDEVRVWSVERSGAQVQAAYNTTLAGNETGLVGYWRFSETSGTTAIDSSTQGYNGVLGNGVTADVPARTANLDYTTNEDTVLSVAASGVLNLATDPEGSALTAVLVSGPSNAASFTLNPDGSFSYTPNTNFNGTDSFVFSASDGSLSSRQATVNLTVSAVNDAPTGADKTVTTNEDTAYTFSAADFGFNDVDAGDTLSGVRIDTLPGAGSLTLSGVAVTASQVITNANIGNLVFTPVANANGGAYATLTFSVRDQSSVFSAPNIITVNVTTVNDAPTTSTVTLAAIAEDSGVRLITQAQLLGNAADIDGPSLTATGLAIASGAGTLVDNGNGTWNYTPASNDDTAVSFTYTVTDGSLTVAGTANLDITPVNDAPTTSTVTLAAIAEDSGVRLVAQAQLLGNAVDVDGPSLTATALAITSGSGTLVDNGNGTWNYTPAADDDTAASFTYTVTDGSLTVVGSANLDITPVNDAPTGADKSITINEDATYTFSAADFGFNDVDAGDTLSAVRIDTLPGAGSLALSGVAVSTSQVITAANIGNLVFAPAANANGSGYASFTFSVRDQGSAYSAAPNNITVNVTAVNDTPTTGTITLAAFAEDSSVRLITQGQLLGNAADVDGPSLTATALAIASGGGTLVDNGDGTWNYTPASNDDTAVSFTYNVTDGSLTAVGTANLDITPVNDAPTTSVVSLAALAEDSGIRLITQAQLLGNAADVDGPGLTATGLAIASGSGTLVDNGNGTWNYTPAANDDTAVSFTYTVTDGSLTAAGTANLDITPVNDEPTTSTVTLAAIAEDSGVRLITQAQLLGNAADVDGPGLTATGLAIASGSGTLVDNGNGTWNYTPAADDDTAASFTYTVTDGSLTAAGTANLDITPVNDAPTTSAVTLAAIAEDSGVRLITQAQLLGNAADVDGPGLTATAMSIGTGAGALVDNGNGTWNYTPATNDATAVSFTYTVTDGGLTAAGTANLDITPVNDAPAGTSTTLALPTGVTHIFSAADFGFVDPADSPANALSWVEVASLPTSGQLTNNGVAVTAGQWVDIADITAGHLVFAPVVNGGAGSSASITFLVRDDGGTPGGGADTSINPATLTLTVPAVSVVIDPVITLEPPPLPPAPPSPVGLPGGVESAPVAGTGTGDPAPPAGAARSRPGTQTADAGELGGSTRFAPTSRAELAPQTELPGTGSLAGNGISQRNLSVPVSVAVENGLETLKMMFARFKAADVGSADQVTESQRGLALQNVAAQAAPVADDAAERGRGTFSTTGSIELTGVVMSAGFVAWALRGGGLLASLAASVPAWRSVDPLPVLAPEEDKPDWDDATDPEADREERALSRLWSARSRGEDFGDTA
jgi:hypothetical protein